MTYIPHALQSGGGSSVQPVLADVPATPGTPAAPAIATTPPLPPIPEGGGRLIVDKRGDQTIFTTTEAPPQFLTLVDRAQETAFGLMALLAAIVILGPFARMYARRIERRSEIAPVNANSALLQQQLLQLQQSMDAMSVEVERISESQRFQSRLMSETRSS